MRVTFVNVNQGQLIVQGLSILIHLTDNITALPHQWFWLFRPSFSTPHPAYPPPFKFDPAWCACMVSTENTRANTIGKPYIHKAFRKSAVSGDFIWYTCAHELFLFSVSSLFSPDLWLENMPWDKAFQRYYSTFSLLCTVFELLGGCRMQCTLHRGIIRAGSLISNNIKTSRRSPVCK